MNKTIGDIEFNEALRDRNNINIMNKVCSKYFTIIPYDEIERCKLISLWSALQKYDPEKGKKFTSFLYSRITWECKKQCYKIRRDKRCVSYNDSISLSDDVSYKYFELEDLIQQLHPRFRIVIKQKFFYRFTMEEIAGINDFSRETARRYVIEGLKKLEKLLDNGV